MFQKMNCRTVVLAVLTFIFPVIGSAQNIQRADANANSIVGLDARVDPASLGLNIIIGLGNYQNRGSRIPVTLRYSSKVWDIRFVGSEFDIQQNRELTFTEPNFASENAAGWSHSLSPPKFGNSVEYFDEYGNGVDLNNKVGGWTAGDKYYTVPRIRIRTPDGILRELRRGDWIAENLYGSASNPDILTGDFYSVDGSRLRYNSNDRTLYLPDGSRYINEQNSGAFTKFVDKDGNVLNYTVNGLIDTLGRFIPVPPGAPAFPQDISYSVPSFNTQSLVIFKWKYLADSLTSVQALRHKGDCSQLSQPLTPSLFQGNSTDGYVCESGDFSNVFNPIVLSEIVLSNGTSYKFTYDIWGEIDKIQYPTGAYERFEYASVYGNSYTSAPYAQANRGVIGRWLSIDGASSSEIQWQYSQPAPGQTTVTTPDNLRIENFFNTAWGVVPRFGFEESKVGQLREERVYDAAGTFISRRLMDYQVAESTG